MIKRVASLVNNLDNNTIFKIKSNLGNKCLGCIKVYQPVMEYDEKSSIFV